MTISREQTQAKLDKMADGAGVYKPEAPYSIADRFEELAISDGDRVFLIDGERRVSYAELNRMANRYASLGLRLGLKTGDSGAVMLQNRPEFFFAWLGLSKIGVTAALINTFAKDKALAHALSVTNSKILLVGEECLENFTNQPELLQQQSTLVIRDQGSSTLPKGCQWIEEQLETASDNNPDQSHREGIIGSSPAFYCFTSGTTGLPKAAIISHARWLGVGASWKNMLGIDSSDVFYCMLPLFHGAAGMSLTSNAIAAGASIALKRKFSASQFWQDVRRYGVTSTQYIGEVCRYLVNQPEQPNDQDHTLKRMTGAGMTPEVWRKFLKRFGDIQIIEGMGATESNCSLVNPDGKIGACARIPFRDRSNARLVKFDLDNNCHVRDANGFLVECEPGEVGELIGMILNIPGMAGGRFEGYTDPVATEKKILRNVFQEGDAWFATGDLLCRDEDDYYYFVDRIGDTFRWKSENVSTTEVTEALEDYDDAEVINIYGVKVPDHEGRAGMAAVQMRKGHSFDPKRFYDTATGKLPHYAVPLFVRVADQSDLTPTFKLRKVDLQRQGYSPDLVSEPLYALDHESRTYQPYSEAALKQLDVKSFIAEKT